VSARRLIARCAGKTSRYAPLVKKENQTVNPMELFFAIVVSLLLIAAARMIFKRGLIGAILGGSIEKTYGDFYSSKTGMVTHRFKVHRVIKKNSPHVVIEYRQGSFGSGKLIPIELSKQDAEKLADFLKAAADEI
jgi:hypothetical protein